ncbi:hypothetical protein JCM19236_4945 [Vibrio sp. JCM 19236]|nr:hypothetical protein JCM19236_4945 [Vibrio sp. JCM 19236]
MSIDIHRNPVDTTLSHTLKLRGKGLNLRGKMKYQMQFIY